MIASHSVRSNAARPRAMRERRTASAPRLLLSIMLALAASSGSACAETILRGTVADSVSGEALIGANVYLVETAHGGVTDRQGEFRITGIPAGRYQLRVSYIGYHARELDITLVEDEAATLDIRLLVDVIESEEIVVTTQLRGQVAAINQQLTANTIMNVISEEKIQELPDANAAEAIGRLPGVSILRSGGEANKVILRGLSDRFTTITVDGIRIPPTDADSRGVDLSTIAQGSLAGVELYKALTADMDADAIAGSVNLATKKAPASRFLRFDVRGGYNQLDDSFAQYDFAMRYGERFFGDVLGVQLTGNLEQRRRSNEQLDTDYYTALANYTDYTIENFTPSYTNEVRKRGGWTPFPRRSWASAFCFRSIASDATKSESRSVKRTRSPIVAAPVIGRGISTCGSPPLRFASSRPCEPAISSSEPTGSTATTEPTRPRSSRSTCWGAPDAMFTTSRPSEPKMTTRPAMMRRSLHLERSCGRR